MKKIFSLLGLLVCFVSAQAAATVVYQRALADWVATDVGTGAWVGNASADSEKGLYVSGTGNRNATLTFNHTDFSIQTIDLVFNNAGNTGDNNNFSYVDIGNAIRIRSNQQAQNGHVIISGTEMAISNCNLKGYNRGGDLWTIHVEINTATNQVTALTLVGTEMNGKSATFTLAEAVDLGSSATYNTVTLGTNRAKGSPAAGIQSITIAEEEQDLSTAAYKINYKLGDVTVKTVEGTAAVDGIVNAVSPFVVENQKYYIVDGAQVEFPVAITGNVFDVAVRKANEYTCTVKTSLGETLSTKTVIEGENTNYYVPYYNFSNGKFYTSPTSSAGTISYGQGTINNVTSNIDVILTYTEEANTKVVFYSEAENLLGITEQNDGYTNSRMSNGAAGYFADPTQVTSLQPGVYTLTAATRAGTTKFTVNGSKEILNLTSSGSVVTATSEEFVISKESAIVATAGSSKNYFDYVIIRKVADYVATENLTINDAEITIGQNTQMSATLNPSNASNKTLTWTIKESNSINAGEAEIDAATGEITPLKAGLIAVEVTNGEKTDFKEFTIAAAQFDATITGTPESFENPVEVIVGEDKAENGETLFVSTKEGYDNMQNTSLLQPVGSVTATKIPTYIYSITVDKKNKTVDVVYEEDIEVTAMNFEVTDQRIALGNSRTLQVTYSPANASFKTAKWTSSNPEVATVDENTGLVTAVSEGETTITAEWSENAEHETNISTQMTLTVDKGLVLDRIVYDELDDATAEVMGYYHPLDGDTLFLPAYIESNGRMIPVSFIKQEAFIGSNLKSIVIPGTVKTIDHRAMMYSNTHNAYEELPEDGLESAFLLEGVEVMRDRIFHGNKYMKKVFLPSTLTDIGYYSFFDTAIEDVYFGGTEEQWNALKNLENAKLPETAKLHFNSNFTAAFINSIEVEEDYAEIAVGEEYEIEASIIPEEIAPVVALTYTSSNEEVATVDEEGVVTGIADGYVTITVSAGEGVEAKVRVKVGDGARDLTTPLLTTWSVQGGANPEGIFVDEEEHYYNNWGAGTAWFAQAYAQFDLSNLMADDDFKAKFTVWVNCARGTRTFDVYGLPAGTTVADCQELTAKKGVELATYSDITTEYTAKEVDVTDYIKTILAEGGSDAIIIMSNGAAGGKIYGKGSAEFAPTLNIYPANGEGGNQATGISEAKAEKTVKNGKYVENGQIVIYIDGKKFNAAGQELK